MPFGSPTHLLARLAGGVPVSSACGALGQQLQIPGSSTLPASCGPPQPSSPYMAVPMQGGNYQLLCMMDQPGFAPSTYLVPLPDGGYQMAQFAQMPVGSMPSMPTMPGASLPMGSVPMMGSMPMCSMPMGSMPMSIPTTVPPTLTPVSTAPLGSTPSIPGGEGVPTQTDEASALSHHACSPDASSCGASGGPVSDDSASPHCADAPPSTTVLPPASASEASPDDAGAPANATSPAELDASPALGEPS